MNLIIKVEEKRNFTASEAKKLEAALEILKHVINSEAFKISIHKHKYRGKETFVDNYIIKGGRRIEMSNGEIYKHFMSGAEDVGWEEDGEMNLRLGVSNAKCTSTIGYTSSPSNRITTYRCWLARYEPYEYAAHLAHEYCHCAGFSHDEDPVPSRPYSVPYAVGKIVRRIADAAFFMKEFGSFVDIEQISGILPEKDFDVQEEGFNNMQ